MSLVVPLHVHAADNEERTGTVVSENFMPVLNEKGRPQLQEIGEGQFVMKQQVLLGVVWDDGVGEAAIDYLPPVALRFLDIGSTVDVAIGGDEEADEGEGDEAEYEDEGEEAQPHA